jgi:hypothetical protein
MSRKALTLAGNTAERGHSGGSTVRIVGVEVCGQTAGTRACRPKGGTMLHRYRRGGS